MVDINTLKDSYQGDYSEFRRDGQGQFSPVIADNDELFTAALDVADIIERTGRRTLNFSEFLDKHPRFVPDCAREDVDMNILEESESNSDHVGGMKKEELLTVLDSKEHCAMCPIKRECLAVSMTQPQMSLNRRTEPRLPKRPSEEGETINLVMSEYLIFGGYTPQERKIIFKYIREILIENDRHELELIYGDTSQDQTMDTGFTLEELLQKIK